MLILCPRWVEPKKAQQQCRTDVHRKRRQTRDVNSSYETLHSCSSVFSLKRIQTLNIWSLSGELVSSHTFQDLPYYRVLKRVGLCLAAKVAAVTWKVYLYNTFHTQRQFKARYTKRSKCWMDMKLSWLNHLFKLYENVLERNDASLKIQSDLVTTFGEK